VDHHARAYWIFNRIRGYRRFEAMLHSLEISKDEVAQERAKILKFDRRYGEEATKEAFAVDRKLIHVWRQRLRDNETPNGINSWLCEADLGQKDEHR
jgi:hypothetical protein